MADTPRPVEINGLVFATTGEGHLLESEVRRQVEALQREIADLQGRLEHVTSLERLAQATVMKADDLASEIETEARRRVDQLIDECETELVGRRRQFEIDSGAQQAAAQARVAQLQAALEGTLQTLGRALQAAGAPALEMPAASAPAWSPVAATPVAEVGTPVIGHDEAREGAASAALPDDEAADVPQETPPRTFFAADPVDVQPEQIEQDASHEAVFDAAGERDEAPADEPIEMANGAASAAESGPDWGGPAYEPVPAPAEFMDAEPVRAADADGLPAVAASEHSGGTFELARPARSAPEPTPIRPSVADRADEEPAAAAAAEAGPSTLSRIGPATIEIDMRPVKSFADLARVTKLLGRIAPGAQPVDLNLPQHRALFSVRAKDPQALAAQLQEALPEAKVVEREEGLDVLLEGGE